ncbi:MAG: hypothetical protein O7C68_05160 [Rickettsia endosymbiont of Ixodes ricinus]|uniref:Uncharacterized protein n=1 Tax=Rickettsia helvetica TaxID=35789 RepID=A0ABP0T612_RICHE|nr:hypothetical protein [Rickettsia helvetica]MCZ6884523.1 hypothetical protein [Rickettsia endosymbiont of Ixodes ricinus]MCZ6896957.1 hypothetical protein [Rickettsia endosymbiont of Ixodes ricinus]
MAAKRSSFNSIFKLADQRYKRGNIDYLTVFTAKQNVLQNEIDGVSIKLSQLSSMVNIFHALGGRVVVLTTSLRATIGARQSHEIITNS